MVKKLSILLLAVLLVLGFSFTQVQAVEDMPEKPDELSIIALDIDVDQFGEGVEIFEETYGIEVEWMEYPYGELHGQISTSIAGGSTFDLYMMSNSWHPEFGQLGMAVPLTDIVSQEKLDEINEKFFEATVDNMTSHDEQWALPGTAATVTFFYNKAMLEELGYEEPPATFPEWLEAGREAMEQDLATYAFFPGWLSAHEDGMVQFDIMLKMHGGSWMNEDQTEWTFNSEAGVEALTLMKEILDEGLVPRAALEQSDWDNFHYFLAGDQLFEINWNFVYPQAVDPERSEIVDDIGYMVIPGIEEDDPGYTVLGGGGYAISPTTRSPEWAFRLLDYMHRDEGALGVMEEQGGAEATIEKFYTEEYDDMFPSEDYPLREVYGDQMENAGFRPGVYLTWYSEFRDNIFTPAMHRALLGEQDVEEALNEAYEEAQEMLEAEGL